MLDERKLSQDAMRMLSYFHRYPEQAHYGQELTKRLEIPSATVVRWLLRLEDSGWLKSEFQRGPRQTHRPKRYYTLTRKGFESSRRLLKSVATLDTVQDGAQGRVLEASSFTVHRGACPERVGERVEQGSLF